MTGRRHHRCASEQRTAIERHTVCKVPVSVGVLERTFGGTTGGMGGSMAGTIFGSLAAGFVGSMIAHQFFDAIGNVQYDDVGAGQETGDGQYADPSGGYDGGDFGGDFGGDI